MIINVDDHKGIRKGMAATIGLQLYKPLLRAELANIIRFQNAWHEPFPRENSSKIAEPRVHREDTDLLLNKLRYMGSPLWAY